MQEAFVRRLSDITVLMYSRGSWWLRGRQGSVVTLRKPPVITERLTIGTSGVNAGYPIAMMQEQDEKDDEKRALA